MSDAMSTLGGSPMAVAAPPILEKITVAIKTWTEIKREMLSFSLWKLGLI